MATAKLKIAILFGGRSSEHEISLMSAVNIIAGLDQEKYEIIPIGITRRGHWVLVDAEKLAKKKEIVSDKNDSLSDKNDSLKNDSLPASSNRSSSTSSNRSFISIIPGQKEPFIRDRGPLPIDILFPVLHGPYGEDGSLQGFLKLLNKPFVGADILASAVGMDKDIMKRLLRERGIAVADYITITHGRSKNAALENAALIELLGLPLYVKPAAQGSSVGISRAGSLTELEAAIDFAFQYDRKVIVEKAISGRELECAILGNQTPLASPVGEIIPVDGFYSYEAKYLNPQGAQIKAPASLTEKEDHLLRQQAVRCYQALDLNGLARVDMFLTAEGEILINEVNTMPGFTDISMYPKLWAIGGLPLPHLLDRLIELALQWHNEQEELKIFPD